MPGTIDDLRKFQQRRQELKAQLAALGDMRPGSLVGRFRKCGKPSCHCAEKGSAGHGPSWSLTRRAGGRTVTRVIPAGEAVERTREQLAEYQRFRRLTRELVEVSERLCHLQLEAVRTPSPGGVQKGGSRKSSSRKSSRRLERS